MENMRIVIIHDEHSQAARELVGGVQALQAAGELPDELHLLPLTDALREALPIRAVPVALCITAYSQEEETVTALNMLRKVNFYKQQDEIETAALPMAVAAMQSGALSGEGIVAIAELGLLEQAPYWALKDDAGKNMQYAKDDLRWHKFDRDGREIELLFRCLQAHSTAGDANRAPNLAPSLWMAAERKALQEGEYAEIVGGGELVRAGETRRWAADAGGDGKLYTAQVDVYAYAHYLPDKAPTLWKLAAEAPGGGDTGEVKLWAAGETVAVGDKRMYNGVVYTVLQAHTTQAGWEPPNVAALWKVAA